MKKWIVLTLVITILFALTGCHGQTEKSATEPETETAAAKLPESVVLYSSHANFELEDADGNKTVCKNDVFSSDGGIEITDKRFLEGGLGDYGPENSAYMFFTVPYSEQYTFRVENPGFAFQETTDQDWQTVWGDGLRAVTWRLCSMELEGDPGKASYEAFQNRDTEQRYIITLSFYMEGKASVDWVQNTMTVRGASGEAEIYLYKCDAMLRSQTVTLPIRGDFTVSTEALAENILTYTDESGTQTVPLTWKPLD
jgi:hypothetical protein